MYEMKINKTHRLLIVLLPGGSVSVPYYYVLIIGKEVIVQNKLAVIQFGK